MSEINNEKLIDKQQDNGTKFLGYDFIDGKISKYSMLLWFTLSIILLQIFMGNGDDYTYFQYVIYSIEIILIFYAFRKNKEFLVFNNGKYSTFDVVFDALFSIGSLKNSSFDSNSSNPISFLGNIIKLTLNKYGKIKKEDLNLKINLKIFKK